MILNKVYSISRRFRVVGLCVIFGVLTIIILAMFTYRWMNEPLNLESDIVVNVKQGDTLSALSYRLYRQGILRSQKLLSVYARATKQTQLQVGEYRLPKGTNHQQLLALLQSGNVLVYNITLVEGRTFKQWLTLLHNHEKLVRELDIDKDIIEQLQLNIDHLEGLFFPDTYQFSSGASDRDILQRAYQRMEKILNDEWENRSDNLPYKNAYEALIMASIVEKETGVAHERPEIAGVFVRRLQKGMRLQTDPTIIYGLGDAYKGNIRRKHLTQATPYNTYVIDGLPPTPIAMPGREAIHAALHPKSGSSLYFVAKGDGSHQFSDTLAEHNKAVYQYQIKKRKKDYRSSPQ